MRQGTVIFFKASDIRKSAHKTWYTVYRFMSNRGRQNVASFLTKDLRVDWRIDAEFFESHLVDHENVRSACHFCLMHELMIN